jgi:hypothetical protein
VAAKGVLSVKTGGSKPRGKGRVDLSLVEEGDCGTVGGIGVKTSVLIAGKLSVIVDNGVGKDGGFVVVITTSGGGRGGGVGW